MNRRVVRRITIWLILGLVILGCATPMLATSPPPVSAPGSVDTIIIQTAGAAQTQTVVALPPTNTPTPTSLSTKTITITPTPTATFLFWVPTNTSLPEGFLVDEEDEEDDSGGFIKTPTPREWACRILYKSPPDDAIIYGGSSLKTVWTVQNTGTKTWPKKGVDIVFVSGARLNAGKPYYDIPAGVGPGGTVAISITMEIPKRKGTYATRWSLKVGRTNFCSVRFVFEVK